MKPALWSSMQAHSEGVMSSLIVLKCPGTLARKCGVDGCKWIGIVTVDSSSCWWFRVASACSISGRIIGVSPLKSEFGLGAVISNCSWPESLLLPEFNW